MNRRKAKLKNKIENITRENITLALTTGIRLKQKEILHRLNEVKKWILK
jgi:hypothetical protein